MEDGWDTGKNFTKRVSAMFHQIFHECSAYIRNWLLRQPHVKEESLTDWLLFEISQKNPAIYYRAFSRHEEALNGTDWEWWILTPDGASAAYPNPFSAYRFFCAGKEAFGWRER